MAVRARNEGLMAADVLFSSFSCLIFSSVYLMPNGCIQFCIQRQDSKQEIIAGNDPVVDRLIGRVENMAGTISGQAEAVSIIGTFLLRKAFHVAHDLGVLL